MKKLNPLLLLLFLLFSCMALSAQKPKVIIDSDTGNEIDDVPAISYALMSGKLDVIGLTAEQWNRFDLCGRSTMRESMELNDRILECLDRKEVLSLRGAEISVGEQWAILPPRPSEASEFIIKSAHEMKENRKLKIICTGALTNVASAIMTDPSVSGKIVVYFIGTNYNFERKAFSKNEFNVRNDLNAFDVLLDSKDLELHILPANVAKNLIIRKEEVFTKLDREVEIENLLFKRWNEVAKEKTQWVMWDIGLIAAILHPEWTVETEHDTPPENTPRKIYLFTDIDEEKIMGDFWKVYLN